MRIPYRVKQTLTNIRYKKYKSIKKFFLQDRNANVVVFDMRNLIPDRRIAQIAFQLKEAGYVCCMYFPNYYYWMKAAFLHNWRHTESLFDQGIVKRVPDNTGLIVSNSKEQFKFPCLELNDSIMTDTHLFVNKEFFYPIHFHPTKMNRDFEKECLSADVHKRQIGIVFVGNTGYEYRKHEQLLHKKYGLYSRCEIIDYLKVNCAQWCFEPSSHEEMLVALHSGELFNKVVIIDKFRLLEDYFDILKKARCFIALPGVIIPYCHNHIESAACGCVPISQLRNYYPAYNENCITFNTLDELRDVCKKVLDQGSNREEMVKRSMSVISWYKKHWSFNVFKSKVDRMLCSQNSETYYVFKEQSQICEIIEKTTGFHF